MARKVSNQELKPMQPIAPIPPTEFWVTEEIDEEIWSGEQIALSKISLSNNLTLNDLVVSVCGDGYVQIGTFRVKNIPNKNFNADLKRYKKRLKKYNDDLAAWKIKVADWELREKQRSNEELELKLNAAEELLKKHGRLAK